MTLKLSEGALQTIMTGGTFEAPVMQVLATKKLVSHSTSERYRLLVSDGVHLNSFAMVATQLNDLVSSGKLKEFTIVQIKKYITTMFNDPQKENKRVMVILDIDILKDGSEVGIRLGNPQTLDLPALNSATSIGSTHQSESAPKPTHSVSATIPSARPKPDNMKVSSNVSGPIHPISSLNPYQNKWSIKARVTQKQPVRTYTNARGSGKLFSVVFTDESGEIKCTGFNSAVDKFETLLELNRVYIVSNCSVKPANKKFTQADYEMTFNDDSIVSPCSDDVSLPSTMFKFVPIAKIGEAEVDSLLDVIGVAKNTSDVQSLVARTTGRELKKREVTLVDQTNNGITLTLWGEGAVTFDGTNFPVVAAKGVRVTEFKGGKSLSCLNSSSLQIDPDIPEAYKLRGWYDNGGDKNECVSLSTTSNNPGGGNWIRLGELTSQRIGLGDKADYFSSVVHVLMSKSDNCLYKACPEPECKKKLLDMNNGVYRCEKCDKEFNRFTYRMLLSVQVSDYTGSTWATVFHDEAQKLLGVEAQEIGNAMENGDETYKEYFTGINFKRFQMKFRTKMETYNDEKRLKTTVVSVEPVDYQAYMKRLLDQFQEKAGLAIKPIK